MINVMHDTWQKVDIFVDHQRRNGNRVLTTRKVTSGYVVDQGLSFLVAFCDSFLSRPTVINFNTLLSTRQVRLKPVKTAIIKTG